MTGFELNPRDIRPQDVERAEEQAERVQALADEEEPPAGNGYGTHL